MNIRIFPRPNIRVPFFERIPALRRAVGTDLRHSVDSGRVALSIIVKDSSYLILLDRQHRRTPVYFSCLYPLLFKTTASSGIYDTFVYAYIRTTYHCAEWCPRKLDY